MEKRDNDASLMELKREYMKYDSLRRQHDAQIIQIGMESGIRMTPEYDDNDDDDDLESFASTLKPKKSSNSNNDDETSPVNKTKKKKKKKYISSGEFFSGAADSTAEDISFDYSSLLNATDNTTQSPFSDFVTPPPGFSSPPPSLAHITFSSRVGFSSCFFLS